MFNPQARAHAVAITPRHACIVVDEALLEPERWVGYAREHRAAFADSAHNAFPGPELPFPQPVVERFAAFFAAHARGALGGRRTLDSRARLSLTIRTPAQLHPQQWMCHVDNARLEPGQCILASVLYLFRQPELGGTAFYAPNRPLTEIAAMKQAAGALPPERFAAEYGIEPGYLTGSNAWFRKLVSVPARWNRMIFYSGTVLHTADIMHPELLVDDPAQGRLTINAFFTCTRKVNA